MLILILDSFYHLQLRPAITCGDHSYISPGTAREIARTPHRIRDEGRVCSSSNTTHIAARTIAPSYFLNVLALAAFDA